MDIKVRFIKDFKGHKSGSESTLPATIYWPLRTSGKVIRLKDFTEQPKQTEQPKKQITKKK